MAIKRTKRSEDAVGGRTLDLIYNDNAGGIKILGPSLGKLRFIGALNIVRAIAPGKLVAIYNNNSSVGFINTGTTSTIPIPTGFTDGYPCRPNDYTIFAMGEDGYLVGSSANLYAYEILDETSFGML